MIAVSHNLNEPSTSSLTDRGSNQRQSSCTLLHVRSKSIVASFSGDQLGGPEVELEGWKYIDKISLRLGDLYGESVDRKPVSGMWVWSCVRVGWEKVRCVLGYNLTVGIRRKGGQRATYLCSLFSRRSLLCKWPFHLVATQPQYYVDRVAWYFVSSLL
jgi:hypothetical protein